ncbi:hypothetical protein CFP56_000481, partial [Quercus suber]
MIAANSLRITSCPLLRAFPRGSPTTPLTTNFCCSPAGLTAAGTAFFVVFLRLAWCFRFCSGHGLQRLGHCSKRFCIYSDCIFLHNFNDPGLCFAKQILPKRILMKLQKSISNKIRPVSNNLNIIFLLTTSVKECNEESELIPMHAFEFATYNCINNRLNDNSYLTDMIGKLTAVGPIEQVHFDSGSTNIRNLQILLPDMDGKAGKLNLNTTSASKVYINLDITEVFELIDRYKVVEDEYDNVVRSIPARDKKPKYESELILQTTMSLAEIKALEWVEGVK